MFRIKFGVGVKDALGWGFVLWLIGYVLGIVFFAVVPPNMIGWVIMPIGVIITLWVLLKRVKGDSFRYYLFLAIAWTLIAIVFDYYGFYLMSRRSRNLS